MIKVVQPPKAMSLSAKKLGEHDGKSTALLPFKDLCQADPSRIGCTLATASVANAMTPEIDDNENAKLSHSRE